MRFNTLVIPGLCFALLAAPGCSDSGPVTPSPTATVTGTWSGDLALPALDAPPTRMVWTLTQTGSSVTGPVLVLLSSGVVLMNGTLNATLSGSELAYTIDITPGGIPSLPVCGGRLAGSVTAALGATSTLGGSYAVASSTCTTPFTSGTFTLTRG